MKSAKFTLVGGLVAALLAIGWYYQSPNARRLKLNETSIRELHLGIKVWEASDYQPTADLGDLVDREVLDHIPQYLSASGQWLPFIFNAGVEDTMSGSLVSFAAPEDEANRKRLIVRNDCTVEYLTSADAKAAIEHTRAEVRPNLERILERRRDRERKFGKDRGEIKPSQPESL